MEIAGFPPGPFHAESFKDIKLFLLGSEVAPAGATQGSSWWYPKVNSSETLSIFGDKCPRNGSKNEEMAPRTKTGCPHIGPFVAPLLTCFWLSGSGFRVKSFGVRVQGLGIRV